MRESKLPISLLRLGSRKDNIQDLECEDSNLEEGKTDAGDADE
jgi:hypothetical protein